MFEGKRIFLLFRFYSLAGGKISEKSFTVYMKGNELQQFFIVVLDKMENKNNKTIGNRNG